MFGELPDWTYFKIQLGFKSPLFLWIHEHSPVSLRHAHPLQIQHSSVGPSVHGRVGRVVVRDVGAVALGVVAADDGPSRILALVLSADVQSVAVQEERVSGTTHHGDFAAASQTLLHPTQVCSRLLPCQAVVDAPQVVAAF